MDEWMTLRYYNILVARRPKIKRKQSKKKRKANDILQMSKKKKKKRNHAKIHILENAKGQASYIPEGWVCVRGVLG